MKNLVTLQIINRFLLNISVVGLDKARTLDGALSKLTKRLQEIMGCIRPITLEAETADEHKVPCGSCSGCRDQRSNGWIFRLQQQEKLHHSSLFVTLTYEENKLSYGETGKPTLVVRDIQDFLKRLRKHTKCRTIRYYIAGEYGPKTLRPHYHGIIFDAGVHAIAKAWGNGFISAYPASPATMAYTTKYMCKPKSVSKSEALAYERVPEFSLMSKGLGANYLQPANINYHLGGLRSYLVLPGGQRQALPRYYRDRIFSESQRDEINAVMALQRRENDLNLINEYKCPEAYENARKAAVLASHEKFKSLTHGEHRNKL